MGLFSTHWVGEYEGHKIEVVRRLGGHKFELHLDGQMVDVESSMVNMGKRHLEGTLRVGDNELRVHAVGVQEAFSEGAAVSIDGMDIPMRKAQ